MSQLRSDKKSDDLSEWFTKLEDKIFRFDCKIGLGIFRRLSCFDDVKRIPWGVNCTIQVFTIRYHLCWLGISCDNSIFGKDSVIELYL